MKFLLLTFVNSLNMKNKDVKFERMFVQFIERNITTFCAISSANTTKFVVAVVEHIFILFWDKDTRETSNNVIKHKALFWRIMDDRCAKEKDKQKQATNIKQTEERKEEERIHQHRKGRGYLVSGSARLQRKQLL